MILLRIIISLNSLRIQRVPKQSQSLEKFSVNLSFSVALFSSVSYNLYQFSANSRLSDNDIKFRYIKAFGEIIPENLLKLETIFEYEPDKQKQRSLRRMVEEHEQRVAQRARALEQARLKEAQADQLRLEAEQIKQSK